MNIQEYMDKIHKREFSKENYERAGSPEFLDNTTPKWTDQQLKDACAFFKQFGGQIAEQRAFDKDPYEFIKENENDLLEEDIELIPELWEIFKKWDGRYN